MRKFLPLTPILALLLPLLCSGCFLFGGVDADLEKGLTQHTAVTQVHSQELSGWVADKEPEYVLTSQDVLLLKNAADEASDIAEGARSIYAAVTGKEDPNGQ